MIIKAIVYAENEEMALDKAEGIFERLCENQTPFDYYTMFRKEDETHSVSGEARWGKRPPVLLADSVEGKKSVEESWKYRVESFKDVMKENRKNIAEMTDEDFLSGKNSMALYYLSSAGRYEGADIYLYDNDGEGIRDVGHLKDALNKWNDKEYEGLNVYVVPADVHY